MVVCGHHAVRAAITTGRARRLWICGSGERIQQTTSVARKAKVMIQTATAAELSARADGALHQGVVADAALPPADWKALLHSPPRASLIALDGVTDPRNLGAVMRAARAFDVAGVIATSRRCAPLSAAAVRASAGAAAFLPLYRATNLRRALLQLQDAGFCIVGADENAESVVGDVHLTPPLCWVLGGEGGGLRRLTAHSCDIVVRAPTAKGDAGCLNVAAACAVMLALATQNRLPE